MSQHKAQSEWSDSLLDILINGKELLAVIFGLKYLCSDNEDCLIHVVTDNTTAVAHTNKMGGVKSCNDIVFKIWEWCEERKKWLYATHIPRQDNDSRLFISKIFPLVEWELNDVIFRDIVHTFGLPTVDLFASRHNAKIEKYCSWFSDSYCWRTDAFSFEWSGEFFYIFPPFRLAGRCWRKIIMEKTLAILCSNLAQPTLVHFCSQKRKTSSVVQKEKTQYLESICSVSSQFKKCPPYSLPLLNFDKAGFSKPCHILALHAWREGTRKTYRL